MAGEILMPALSPTMTEGRLAKWLVKPGQKIAAGDVIAEIETDKATMEVEAAEDGVIDTLLVAEGTDGVAVNSVIARLAGATPAAAPAVAAPVAAPVVVPVAVPQMAAAQVAAPVATAAAQAGPRLAASPLARRLAREKGVDLATLSGSGPGGRIVRADVLAAASAGTAMPATAAAARAPAAAPAAADIPSRGAERLPLNAVRRVTARRLLEAKQSIPHFYVEMDMAMERLLDLRERLNAQSPKDGDGAYKLSVNDLIVKATAAALRRVPDVNVSFAGDAILRHAHIDIALAVAINGGLITPVLRDVDQMGLVAISRQASELARRARAGKLLPEEYQGGTFSISNMGMFGVSAFSAIINPPQAAILAVAAVEDRAVVRGGAIVPGKMMTATLSVDHRAIDGALAAEFLRVLKSIVEEPGTMLL